MTYLSLKMRKRNSIQAYTHRIHGGVGMPQPLGETLVAIVTFLVGIPAWWSYLLFKTSSVVTKSNHKYIPYNALGVSSIARSSQTRQFKVSPARRLTNLRLGGSARGAAIAMLRPSPTVAVCWTVMVTRPWWP